MYKETLAGAIVAILKAESGTQLAAFLGTAAGRLGFEYCLLDIEIDRPLVGRLHCTTGHYPQDWHHAYLSRNYRAIDPTVRHGRTSTQPLMWSHDLQTLETAGMWELARHHGLANGFCVPVHGLRGLKSMLTLARREALPSDAGEVSELVASAGALANCAHVVGARLLLPALLEQSVPALSTREKDCLQWAARGLTSVQIGERLHIAPPTVVFHINKTIRKIGAKSRTQAIARGLALGLLDE